MLSEFFKQDGQKALRFHPPTAACQDAHVAEEGRSEQGGEAYIVCTLSL